MAIRHSAQLRDAMASQLAITDELVRKALKSGVRKDLQAAAKSAGIKANGTNVAMTQALREYMEARADAAERETPGRARPGPAPARGDGRLAPRVRQLHEYEGAAALGRARPVRD